MHLYKTQNIFFDFCLDNIKTRSIENVIHGIDQFISSRSGTPLKKGVVAHALEKEQYDHGFSVVNGVLICHAKVKGLLKRQTLFMRLENSITSDETGGEPIDMVACTLSPARLGALNLRYLSRLTRFFRNKDLVDDLHSVNSTDGIEILLNDIDAIQKDIAA